MTTYSNRFYINKAEELYYTIKRIKKRIIHIPCDNLKSKQRYLLNAIKWIFPCKFDTITSAKIHAGKKWILKMDIKDFYNSVPSYEIQRVIKSVYENVFSISENLFSYFNLVTINGKLPTGAPTSFHIANACFKQFDENIRSLCEVLGVDYTRYVDDLTFSSYSKESLKIVEEKVKAILEFNGYKLNNKKTKYISSNKQQNVLGLVVNDYRVRLPKTFKRNIRAMLHNYSVNKCHSNLKDTKYLIWDNKEELRLKGYISYLKHVDNVFYKHLQIYAKKLEQKYLVIIPFFKNK